MPYIGRGLTTGAQYQKLDDIAINNATTFTMSVGSANVSPDQNHLILVVNGVIQEPGTGFTVSGSTCTLASAITTSGHSGLDTIYGVIAGDAAYAAYDSIGANALGVTAGTVTASRAIVPDGNKDIASFRNVTLTGELDAATLDISGNADIDGTTNLDAVDIDGAVQIDSTVTVGVDDTGYDVKFFGATSGRYMLWDESNDVLDLMDSVYLRLGTGNDFNIYHDGTNNFIYSSTADQDIIFKGNDGGSQITALTLDMSEGGVATFANNIQTTKGIRAGTYSASNAFTENGIDNLQVHYARFGGHSNAVADILYNAYWTGSAWINDNDSSDSYLLRLNDGNGLTFQVSEAGATPSFTTKCAITNAGDGTFGGRLYTTAGSAAYPSYSFSSDVDTGMYSAGTNELGFSVAGHKVATFNGSPTTDGTFAVFGGEGNHAIIRLYADEGDNDEDKWRILANNMPHSANYGVFQVDEAGIDGSWDTTFKVDGAGRDFYTNDGSVSSLSDKRSKKDIVDLEDGLSIVNQLKPKTFKYNGKTSMGVDDGITRYGFIADDVLEVASHYVGISSQELDGKIVDDFKSLSTMRMIPMMVKAIQELSAEVEALKNA